MMGFDVESGEIIDDSGDLYKPVSDEDDISEISNFDGDDEVMLSD